MKLIDLLSITEKEQIIYIYRNNKKIYAGSIQKLYAGTMLRALNSKVYKCNIRSYMFGSMIVLHIYID